MRSSLNLSIIVGLVAALAVTETTQAGIFGRRRERIKAEVRAGPM